MSLKTQSRRVPDSLAFSPDGTTLVTGSIQGNVQVWDITTGQVRRTLQHVGNCGVVISPDGKLLATDELVFVNIAHPEQRKNGDEVVLRESIRRRFRPVQLVNLWDMDTGRLRAVLEGPDCAVPTFSPDGKTLAVASDKVIQLWDVGEILDKARASQEARNDTKQESRP